MNEPDVCLGRLGNEGDTVQVEALQVWGRGSRQNDGTGPRVELRLCGKRPLAFGDSLSDGVVRSLCL